MRTIHMIVACLGLTLVILSAFEVARIRNYCSVVGQVQVTAGRLYQDRIDTLRERYHHNVLISPSMQSVLSELDSVKGLESGWWVVSGTSGVCCLCGLLGVVLGERRRRKLSANRVLEATAG